jgi:Kef-type K+ transport system membrane component KefB/nucleotide-binding universal stress UspA family protein
MHTSILQAPLPLFVAQAILIIILSRGLGAVAKRLQQPLVIAEIVAGIMLGPSLLGWLFPSVAAALFPKSSMPLLGLTSQVGLVLFMFLIGLELDPRLLKGRGRTSVAISHSSIALPFALGGLLALRMHEELAPPGVRFSAFFLFMGAAMSITAFPVLARILVEKRLLRSRIGAITIACAAVDDVTAWCILAFVVSVARSAGIMDAVRTVALALGYIAIMVWVVRPALARWADRTNVALSQNLVAGVIVLLLLSAWTTELIGIHALFGAFMFGAILPKEGAFAPQLAEKIEDVVVVLLLPLFFAYSGLRTQIGLLNTPEAWLTCSLIILLACVGKFGGSFLAARLTGVQWREASAIGVLMNTRGLVELIALNIGLDLGVITPKLFTMMVLMALVTTFMTSPILERIYPTERILRELAETPESTVTTLPVVARYTALACVAFERSGPGLVTLGAAIAGRDDAHSRLYALRLIPAANRASFVLEHQIQADAAAQSALAPALERAKELAVRARPLSFVSTAPAKDICDVASVKHADVILLGWHKPLLGATMLSGTVHEVMEQATSDVGVFVDRGLARFERVLVPYLGSEHDRAALHLAKRIAENSRAKVTILHVTTAEAQRLGVEEVVHEQFRESGAQGEYAVELKVVPHQEPSQAVIEESKHGYDLVLIGIGRQWGLEHRSFGLQAEAILKDAPVSILVVRAGRAVAPAAVTTASPPRAELATVND